MSIKTSKGPVIDPGLCRCCGSTRKCRLLNVEYESLGVKEVYSDMLLDCFGLLLSHMDGKPSERLVCARCVSRLRDAASFRRQVLSCEETFLQMKMYQETIETDKPQIAEVTVDCAPKVEVTVKTEPEAWISEPSSSCEDMLDDSHADYDLKPELPNEDSNSADDVPLIQQIEKPRVCSQRVTREVTEHRPKPSLSTQMLVKRQGVFFETENQQEIPEKEMTDTPISNDTTAYLRQREKANARKRRFLDSLTPEQKQLKRAKDREYYHRNKVNKTRTIEHLSEQDQLKQRERWRMASRKCRERKKEKEHVTKSDASDLSKDERFFQSIQKEVT